MASVSSSMYPINHLNRGNILNTVFVKASMGRKLTGFDFCIGNGENLTEVKLFTV